MSLKLQIVEDDFNSINIIKTYLTKFSDIEIVAISNNLISAYNDFLFHRPDILLLDIMLGEDNVFDIVDLFKPNKKIIFITGHIEFSIKALQSNAIDYLIKPINELDFNIAIQKSISEVADCNTQYDNLLNTKLAVESATYNDYYFLKDIVYLKALKNYTEIFTINNSKIIASKSLKYFENKLPKELFLRIHHGYLINFHHLNRIEKNEEMNAIMSNNEKLPISFRKKLDLLERLKTSKFVI
ncbi:MAG: LytTR family DNA-binding domain-containing protein [Sediminibacterium sp.]|jgi:two-component system, LytTR family, response regulator